MKIRHWAACLMLVGCAGPQAATGPGEGDEPADQRAVRETVEGFEAALRDGDFARVSELLDPDVLVLEAGGAERSREEYLASHARADAEFLKGARRGESQSAVQVHESGDFAWATTTSQLELDRDGKTAVVDAAETMILRRTDDGWKIQHIHWSSRTRK